MLDAIAANSTISNASPARESVLGTVKLADQVSELNNDSSVKFNRQTANLDNAITDQMRPRGSSSAPGVRFSAAQHVGEMDLDTGIDTIGGPLDLVDKAVDQMTDLGRNAVLAQANQLPPVSMSLGQ